MPPYPGNDLAKLQYENTQVFLFNNEVITVGTPSVAFQLRRERGASYPFGASVEVSFSGDPGDFEFDVQIADTDNTNNYITIGEITSTNATFVGRYDITNLWPKYVRVLPVSLTNAVNATVLLTR
jgi:hypothetical protein